jgi:hypothetical protein
MVDVKALIEKARSEAASPETAAIDTVVGGELVSIEFVTIEGSAWSDLTATHPPRKGSEQDANIGFNTDAVVKDYPIAAVRVAGEPTDAESWADLFSVLDGPTIKNCGTAVWGLNQYTPHKRIVDAKKATAGASEKKQN